MSGPSDKSTTIYRQQVSANPAGPTVRSLEELKEFFTPERYDELHARLLPRKLIVDSTNLCNSNCIFCAYQYREEAVSTLSLDLLSHATRDYAQFHPQSFVTLTPAFGEPLLDRTIFEKVRIAKEHGIQRVQFYTNAILLKKRLAELLASPLDNLEISLADFNRDEYVRIYRVDKYPDVLAGVSLLLKTLKEQGRRLPVKLNLMGRRDWSEIEKEPDYVEFIAPYLTEFVFIDLTRDYDNWNGSIEASDLLPGMTLKTQRPSDVALPCRRAHDLQLLSDGSVRLCGARRLPSGQQDGLVVGNIWEQSFAEIWQSEKTRTVIKSFFHSSAPDVCRDCSYFEGVGTNARRTIHVKPADPC